MAAAINTTPPAAVAAAIASHPPAAAACIDDDGEAALRDRADHALQLRPPLRLRPAPRLLPQDPRRWQIQQSQGFLILSLSFSLFFLIFFLVISRSLTLSSLVNSLGVRADLPWAGGFLHAPPLSPHPGEVALPTPHCHDLQSSRVDS